MLIRHLKEVPVIKNKYFLAKDCTAEAMKISAKYHPKWHLCSDFAKKLHGRNAFQVLGADLKTPSNFLICWTVDACQTHADRTIETGGTGTARSAFADNYNVKIGNLANPVALKKVLNWLK